MATYIPGVQSYMPELKTFTPDYKFLSAVLDTKTTRYNTNYKQLNDLYSKVVYADLSRGDTKEQRNQYIEDLAPKLEKVSGMDLSMQQNVDAARGLFKPFYEDDLIIRDLVTTKTYQKNVKYANDLKNSTDAERRRMYWDTGVKAMNYRMEDFINADPNEALTMPLPTYVEDADLYNRAQKILADSGYKDGIIQEMPDEKGRFIIRRKNGDLLTGPALDYIKNAFANDPIIKDAYYTQAFVQSRDAAAAGIQAGQFANVEEGQRAWASTKIAEYEALLRQKQKEDEKKMAGLKGSNQSWQKFNAKVGVIPGSKNEADMKRQQALASIFGQSMAQTNNLLQTAQVSQDGASTQELLNRAYNIMLNTDINKDLIAAARDFSKMGQELIYKGETAEYARERDFAYFKAEEKIRQDNKIAIEELKATLEGGGIGDPLGDLSVKVTYDDAKTVDVKNANIPEINRLTVVKYNDENTDLMANFLIEHAKATQGDNANNQYTITLKDQNGQDVVHTLAPGTASSKSGDTLYELLHKKNAQGEYIYASQIADLYSKANEEVNGQPTADKPNPFLEKYPSNQKEYNDLKARSKQINTRRELLADAQQREYDHYQKAYELATAGGVEADDFDAVKTARNLGLDFDIFDRQNNTVLSETEFVNKYIQAARAGNIKNADEWFSIDDPNYMKDEVIVEMVMTKQPEGPWIEEPRSRNTGRRIFDTQEATKDAKKIYGAMRDVLNKTQNDSYNMTADEGAGKGTVPTTFQSFNMVAALRGQPAIGSASEVVQNPTYSVDIEPTTFRSDGDAIMFTRDLINQYNTTPKQNSGIVLGEVDEDSDLNSIDDLGLRIFEAYIQDIKAYSTNPKLGKAEDRPQAKLSYSPVFGLPEGEKKYGAYSLVINESWLKKNFPDSFATSNSNYNQQEIGKYTKISFTFDKEQDISVRREGQYNFSAVLNQINNTAGHQYINNIEQGGMLRITPELDGRYTLNITPQVYDPKIGAIVESQDIITRDLSKWMQTNGINDLDLAANRFIVEYLEPLAKQNREAQKKDAKINKAQ